MKPTKKYYAFRLGSVLFEKIRDILNGLKHPNLEKLGDQENLESQTNSIIFYNAELPGASSILRGPSSKQLIALAKNSEDAFKALEEGATDYILTSDLSEPSVSRSLILAERLMQSNSKLKFWKEQHELLLEHCHDSIIVQDDQNKIIFSSLSVERLIGRKTEEMIGEDTLAFIHSDDRKEMRTVLAKLVSEKEKSLKCKYRITTSSGKLKWVEATVANYQQSHDISGFIINMRDIDDEYEAKKQLSLAELKYCTLAESTSDGVWHYDLEKDEVSLSESLCRMLGYDRNKDIKSNQIPDLVHPFDRDKAINGMYDRVNSGLPYESELRIQKKDGEYLWVRAIGNGLKNGKGEVILILGALKNIDKRKKVELNLEMNLELNKNRIENIANGINGVLARHRVHPDRKFENLYISSGSMEMWGLSNDEVITDPSRIWDLLDKTEYKILESAFYTAVNKNEKLDQVYSFTDKEGQSKYLHVIAIPKKFEDGTIEWDSITTDVTALKVVENETREQQLMLQNIISNIDGVVQRFKIYPDGKDELVFLSEGYEKISGIPINEVMGNHDIIWEQIIEEDRQKIVSSMENSLKELTPWQQIWRIVNRRGELKWIQGSGTPAKQEDGVIIFDMVTTEITPFKEITSELASARQEFKIAAKAAHLGLWKFDPINDVLEWDEQMFKIFGVEPDEFTGKRGEWVQALHPDDKVKSVNALADTLNTGTDLEFQFRIIKKDTQNIRHIRASANTILDKNGETVYLVGINWDVTYLVQAQEKIIESNKRYALASKAAQDAIWDLDIKTNILKWNPSFSELFGHEIDLERDHLEDWARLVHPDDHDRVVLGLNRFIEAGKNKWEERYRFKKGNGQYAHVNDRGFIVRDHNGLATRMVGAMRDVTAKTEFLNAIKAQNEKLKKIAWKQSHELRGPLTKVMGLASLVKQDGFKDITVDDFLTYISAAASELDHVIREIVDASEEVGIYDPEEQEILKK